MVRHTTLMVAARSSEELFDLLMSKGADISAKAENGNTPLSLAERKDDQEMIVLLKKLGAK